MCDMWQWIFQTSRGGELLTSLSIFEFLSQSKEVLVYNYIKMFSENGPASWKYVASIAEGSIVSSKMVIKVFGNRGWTQKNTFANLHCFRTRIDFQHTSGRGTFLPGCLKKLIFTRSFGTTPVLPTSFCMIWKCLPPQFFDRLS